MMYPSQKLNFNGKHNLGVATFRVTLGDRAQILLKKATIYENDVTYYFFSLFLHGSNVKSENVNEKISFILCDVC